MPKKLTLKGGKILIPLRCLAGPRCVGNLRLAGRAPRRRASAQAVLTLARKRFAIGPGSRKVVKAPLTRAGKRTMRGRGSIPATLTVRLDGVPGGRTAKATVSR